MHTLGQVDVTLVGGEFGGHTVTLGTGPGGYPKLIEVGRNGSRVGYSTTATGRVNVVTYEHTGAGRYVVASLGDERTASEGMKEGDP